MLGVTHPLYLRYRDIWTKLLDVFEGGGGFIDDSRPYLIAHPREWLDHSIPIYDSNGNVLRYEVNPSPKQASPKLTERRKLEQEVDGSFERIAAAARRAEAALADPDRALPAEPEA